MAKKILAMIIAMTLSVACFASCGDKDDSSKADSKASSATESKAATSGEDPEEVTVPEASFKLDGKEVDTKDLVICTVDGNDIGFDEFRYYYYSTLNSYTQGYGLTLDVINDGKGGFESFMDAVLKSIKQEYALVKLAKENNITLTDEDEKSIEDQIANDKSQFQSEEEYQDALKNNYLTEETYKTIISHSLYYQKLFGENGKLATSKEDFKKIVQDNSKYARVVHILIPYESQAEITDSSALDTYKTGTLSQKLQAKKDAYNALSEEDQAKAKAKALNVAKAVLKKAQDGEDFTELIKKYGWDQGMETSPEGYYVNQNTQFVQEFKDASFKLKENQISGLVESESYGWFIIKRLPVDLDYVDKNYTTMVAEYDKPQISNRLTKMSEKIEVTNTDIYDKITAESIT